MSLMYKKLKMTDKLDNTWNLRKDFTSFLKFHVLSNLSVIFKLHINVDVNQQKEKKISPLVTVKLKSSFYLEDYFYVYKIVWLILIVWISIFREIFKHYMKIAMQFQVQSTCSRYTWSSWWRHHNWLHECSWNDI